MKKKAIKNILILLLTFFNLGGDAGAKGRAALDFKQINKNINTSLLQVVGEFDQLVTFSYQFDPAKTNLAKDQYTIIYRAKLAASAWSDAETVVHGSMGLKAYPQGTNGLEIFLDKTVVADPLAILRFIGSKFSMCPDNLMFQGILLVLAQEDCAVLETLKSIDSLAVLQQIFQDHIQSSKEATDKYVADLAAEIKTVSHPVIAKILADQLQKSMFIQEDLKSIKLESLKQGFILSADQFRYGYFLTIKNMRIEVTENHLRVGGTITIPLGGTLYKASKPEGERLLRALEDNRSYAGEFIKMDARIGLKFMSLMMGN